MSRRREFGSWRRRCLPWAPPSSSASVVPSASGVRGWHNSVRHAGCISRSMTSARCLGVSLWRWRRVLPLLGGMFLTACAHDIGTFEEAKPVARPQDPMPHVQSCPSEPPAAGSACAPPGTTCHYRGEAAQDHLCGPGRLWETRSYALPEGTADAGAPDLVQPPAVSCSFTPEGTALLSCPSPQCTFTCCHSGSARPGPSGGSNTGAQGCVGCCEEESCELIPASDCPAQRCRLRRGCSGEWVCAQLLRGGGTASIDAGAGGPPLRCGTAGYTEGEVPCCEGLVARCSSFDPGGGCAPASSSTLRGPPVCMACGDGVCETSSENRCSCPEDCPG
jgi:hypothetical protein